MKAKLILKHRGDNDYFLLSRSDNSEALVASLNPDEEIFEQKLSKQNCDEIFGVVDVEKLAEEEACACKHKECYLKCEYIAGFNKAMELNKDKVFTEKEVRRIIGKAQLLNHNDDFAFTEDYLIESENEINSI